MRFRTVILFVIAACFVSCDFAHRMFTNEEMAYRVTDDCGKVVVTGVSALSDHVYFSLYGDFVVNPDSIKLIHENKSNDIDVEMRINNIKIDSHEPLYVTGESKLGISFCHTIPIRFCYEERYILICPSNFILCDGSPVINDTVRFTSKGRWKDITIWKRNKVSDELR